MSLLRLSALGVEVEGRTLLDGIDLQVAPGELVGLIGPNGAGKSTLLRAVAQLQRYRGEVTLGGENLAALAATERARRLAYLAQDGQSGWPLTVRDYVALGRIPHRRPFGLPGAEDAHAIEQALQRTALVTLAGRRIDQLSGGERARARLARALAVGAHLLLADEPVAALDPFHQLSVMELLRAQCRAGQAALVVLHDLTLASRFCERILLLDGGLPVACGSARQVLTPANLQRVYKVRAMLGEHEEQRFVLPWALHPESSR